jgi:UDP:flavonoid glycosyltransferase YjiC (YdhE family)
VDEELSLIEAVRPDVVVSDFRFSSLASARLKGVPLLTVANAYWSPYAGQTFVFPEYDYPLHTVVGTQLSRLLFKIFREIGFAAHTRPLNTVLRERGLDPIGGDIRSMYTAGDYTAYADIPGLVDLAGAPSRHQTIGAVLWSPAVPRPDWWEQLPTDRPIIYVTPGSSGSEQLVDTALGALADLPVTVIAATAGRRLPANPPANAWTAEYLPGMEASARSSLVICNGGSPTTYQALAAGVPVIGVVSNNMDQHLNMEVVRKAIAGVVIGARRLKKSTLRESAEEMLRSHEYRDAACRLSRAHQRCDVASRFPELLKRVLSEE